MRAEPGGVFLISRLVRGRAIWRGQAGRRKQKQKTRGAQGPRPSGRLRVEVRKGNLGESYRILKNLEEGTERGSCTEGVPAHSERVGCTERGPCTEAQRGGAVQRGWLYRGGALQIANRGTPAEGGPCRGPPRAERPPADGGAPGHRAQRGPGAPAHRGAPLHTEGLRVEVRKGPSPPETPAERLKTRKELKFGYL